MRDPARVTWNLGPRATFTTFVQRAEGPIMISRFGILNRCLSLSVIVFQSMPGFRRMTTCTSSVENCKTTFGMSWLELKGWSGRLQLGIQVAWFDRNFYPVLYSRNQKVSVHSNVTQPQMLAWESQTDGSLEQVNPWSVKTEPFQDGQVWDFLECYIGHTSHSEYLCKSQQLVASQALPAWFFSFLLCSGEVALLVRWWHLHIQTASEPRSHLQAQECLPPWRASSQAAKRLGEC